MREQIHEGENNTGCLAALLFIFGCALIILGIILWESQIP